MSKARQIIGFNRYGDEYQQAVFRLLIVAITTLYLITFQDNVNSIVYELMFYFGIFTIGLVWHTRKNTTPYQARQIITMLMDVSAASLLTYLSEQAGSAFIGIYLWLIIGYGFRYGNKMLILTYLASFVGFLIAANYSVYLKSNHALLYGFLFALTSIPIYALSLVKKLQEQTRKAEAASQAKSEFLSHISHEIRTPLNGIVGACSLIEADESIKNRYPLFDVIKNSSTVLLDLVNDVLDLATIESGKAISNKEDFYLQNLLITTTNLFETQAIQKGLKLEYIIDDDMPAVIHADLMHTKQVLINLVGNAVKFTQKGSVIIKVSAKSKLEGKHIIRFEVIDTGIGISENAISKIFESFTQAEEDTKYKFGGTGLGTTISKNLVELMGGSIGVDSTLGKGSTFWFELPLEPINHSNQAEVETSEIISFKKFASNEKKKSYRILVAEDNDTNILILSQMLKLGNHTFDVVKNGQLALDKLEDNQYDLMILDYNMPEMGGLEALKIYQAVNIGLPTIPAIILSADATEATRDKFDDVEIAAFLTKPIQLNALLEAVEKVGGESNKLVSNNNTAQVYQFEYANKPNTESLQSPVIDFFNEERLAELDAMSQNHQFLKLLINGFIEDTEQQLSILAQHLNSNDYVNIKNVAHAMAGSAWNVGAEQFGRLCEELESITPNHDNPSDLYQAMLATFQNTKQAYKTHLQQDQLQLVTHS